MELFDSYGLTITFIEPLLGTIASDKEVYKRFIATKAPVVDPDETVSNEGREEAGWTTFYRMPGDDSALCLMDYQIKGMLKELGNDIKELAGPGGTLIKALRSKIDKWVFIQPRRIPLPPMRTKEDGSPDPLERPLRALTPQGPRVSVVRSDIIDAGFSLGMVLKVFKKADIKEETLRAILSYGEFQGIGQWRNAGWGRFTYELTPEE